MSAAIKYYLKIFSTIALVYGAIETFTETIILQSYDLQGIVIKSFLFAFLFATILFVIQITAIKKKGVKITEKDFKFPYEKEISSPLSKLKLIDRIKHDSKFKKMTMTEIPNGISLLSGFSGFTWGEKIRIVIEKDGDNNRFNISSHPIQKMNLIDHGRNAKYVERMAEIIEKA